MATKKVEEKVNLGKETVEETKKARKRTRAEMIRELKREASKIDIEVMNLTNGSFIYENGYDSIRMNEPGETAIVGLDLLLKMEVTKKEDISIENLFYDTYYTAVKYLKTRLHSIKEVKDYLSGLTLKGNNQKGYGVIFVDGYPLSFYKESNNQVKNLYPKGLRR